MKKLYTLIILMVAAFALPQTSFGAWNSSSVTIMIDPGHGGSDPGAGRSGYRYEADLVLDCSLAINDWLNARGNPHRLTRTTDATVSLTARRSASISYDPWVFCSVHLNAFNGTANGTETWYYWTSRSPQLAQYTQNALVSKLGRVNRGVKQNGWTVITGASYIPAILTEGLFVDNVDENNMINSRDKAGFKGWVNGHLKGFYDFLNSEGAGCEVNPDSNPWGGSAAVTPPEPEKKPTIKASTSGLHFELFTGETPTLEFNVTGTDLSENITVTSGSGRFIVSPEQLPKEGGTVKVQYKGMAAGEVGTIGEGGSLANGTFFKVNLSSKGASTVSVGLTAEIKPHPLNDLQEKWSSSEKRGSKTSRGYDAGLIRNFAYKDGKLYCVYNHKDILVLNAQTGEKLGFLKRGDVVKGGTLQLCDVKVQDGVVIACNLATAANGEELRLYAWEDDNANPYLLFNTTDFQGANRMGDCLQTTGNFGSDCWFAFGNETNGVTRIIEYNRNHGIWTAKNTEVVTKYGSAVSNLSTQATVRAYPQGDGWWVDGKDSYPSWCTYDASIGKAVRQTYVDTGESWGSSHHEFNWGGQKYSANLVFNGREYNGDGSLNGTSTYKGARMRLIQDPTGDFTRAVQVADYPGDGLGDESRNTNATGDCIINTDGSTYLEGWVLSTTHGLAYFVKNNPPAQNPGKLELDEPEGTAPAASLKVSAASLSFSAQEGSSEARELTVTGENLSGNIDAWLEGANSNLFSITPTSLAAAGGKVTVSYNPGNNTGSHSATLVLRAAGVNDVTVALSGICAAQVSYAEELGQLETKWLYSQNENNLGQAPWFSVASPVTRSIAVAGDKLYSLVGHPWNGDYRIDVIDAYSGVKVGNLSVAGIKHATNYNSASALGVLGNDLILTNAVSASTAHSIRIYRYANCTGEAELLLEEANSDGLPKGEHAGFYGDMNNGKIAFCNGTTVFVYNVKNGAISGRDDIQLQDALGTNASRYEVQFLADGTFYVVDKDHLPMHYDATGKLLETTPAGVFSSQQGTSVKVFDYAKHKYMLVTATTKGWENGKLEIAKITDGLASAQLVASVPENALGTANWGLTAAYSTALCQITGENNSTANFWVLVPQQGIGHFQFEGLRSGVDGIAVDGDDSEAPVEFYNLQGVRLDSENLAPGIYIKRQGRTATKVVIR